MNWYIKAVIENYANFSGKATRQEFWMFYLFHTIFCILAIVLDYKLGLTFDSKIKIQFFYSNIQGWIYLIYSIIITVPFLAVCVRRLHDVGKSGWFILIPIYNLILLVSDSKNKED